MVLARGVRSSGGRKKKEGVMEKNHRNHKNHSLEIIV